MIDPASDAPEQDDDSDEAQEGKDAQVMSFDPDQSDVEDTPDGGAIVKLSQDKPDETEPADATTFYDNILVVNPDLIPQAFLNSLSVELHESIELDIESRKDRDKQYEEGIKRSGLGNEAPGGATFLGASKVVHPTITKACVDFEARTIKEIMPPAGPVKDFIPGEQTADRLQKAQRKTKHMNWQLTRQIPEFRPSLEKLLTQLPLGGVQFQRWRFDFKMRRAAVQFVPVDMIAIPAAADDFYTAERRTFIEDLTALDFSNRVRDGIYVDDASTQSLAMPPEPTGAKAATNRVEGVEQDLYNKDGLRRMFEIEVDLVIDEDPFAQVEGEDGTKEAESRPYIVEMCQESKKILGIRRNWEFDDKLHQNMTWIVEWPFVPWRGAMAIGLVQMMAGIPGATTGALRALLDSAHVNNIPTALRLKGAVQGGGSVQMEATQMMELEGGPGADDIRKLIMPLPFNEPSPVLFQLLGFLVDAGEGVVRTTFEDFAEQAGQNMPVGTTLAMIEQGMAVLSAIHGRMYVSMERTLQVLHRINKMYITDDEIISDTGELLARREDYQGPQDVIPVADPRIFSEVQRYAQMQVISQRADAHPEMYNLHAVEEALLERLKIPNPEQFLKPMPAPTRMNAVNENMACTLGRPISAFPDQDHLAHLQVHLDFITSPMFGGINAISTQLFPGILPHLIEHMIMWYVAEVYKHATEAVGKEFSEYQKFQDPQTQAEADKALAVASSIALKDADAKFEKLPPLLAHVQQVVQQLQAAQMQAMGGGQNPAQVEQVRGQNQQAVQALKNQNDQQARLETRQERMQENNMRLVDSAHGRDNETRIAQMREQGQDARTAETNQTRRDINTADNDTAMAISTAETLTGHRSNLKTGTGINPQ